MNIAFLGLGSMGRGVCRNLLGKGHVLRVWNRSVEKAEMVRSWGAQTAATATDAVAGAEMVLCCLSSASAQKALLDGPQGVLACMEKSAPLLDFATWDIPTALDFQQIAAAHGICYASVPMGKGPEAAEAGQSPMFFGGPRELFERCSSLLSDMGTAFWMGNVSAACAFKLVTNLIGLSNNLLITEGIRLAKAMGISEEAFMAGAAHTGAWSYQLANSGSKVFAEAFLPMRGTLDNALKDMKFGVTMADEAGVPCPVFRHIRDRYQAASEAGYGEEDYTAVYRMLQEHSQ